MHELAYVSEESARMARGLELRFLALPPSSGVVFVSVYPRPAPRGQVRNFDVRLGVLPSLSEDLGVAIARHVLEKELSDARYQFSIEAWRGVAGPAHHAGAGADPS